MTGASYRLANLRVGDRLRYPKGGFADGRPGNLYHVRGFVDGQVVLRSWRSIRGRFQWCYELHEAALMYIGFGRDSRRRR